MKIIYNNTIVPRQFNKVINAIKHSFSRSKIPENGSSTGLDILASQNSMLVTRAQNRVDTVQTQFKSTKEMFEYAKAKCLGGLEAKRPYEYALVMDAKNNRILAEYLGSCQKCDLDDLMNLETDAFNTVIMHGHPNNYPLSSTDINLLLTSKINQVIAINKNGEFSLAIKKPGFNLKNVGNQLSAYMREVCDNATVILDGRFPDNISMEMAHRTLKKHMPNLGIRYVTNYSYLKK